MFKAGDKVRVKDYSWSMEIVKGELKETHVSQKTSNYDGLDWIVLATDLILPTSPRAPRERGSNDTIIYNPYLGTSYFIMNRWLRKAREYCDSCGQELK